MATEQEIIEQTVREFLEKQAADNAAASGVEKPPVTPEPLSLNIAGQAYSFKNKEEMEAAITATFQKANAELETLRAQQNSPVKEGAYVTGKETEPFSQEHYIELMGKGSTGILEAQKYALNHAIFGGKDPNASETIRESLQEAQKVKATLAVYQFRELHPEFPMTNEATQVVDGIRKELQQPFTLQGLEAAYGVAQSRGLVPNPGVLAYQQQLIQQGILPNPTTGQAQNGQQTPPPPGGQYGFQGPPRVNRNAPTTGTDLASVAESLTLEQLEKALRQAGQL